MAVTMRRATLVSPLIKKKQGILARVRESSCRGFEEKGIGLKGERELNRRERFDFEEEWNFLVEGN